MKIIAIPRRFVKEEWGGTETVVLETARELRKRGHDLSIYTPTIFSDVAREDMQGVPIRRFPYSYPVLGLNEQSRLQMDKKGGNLISLALGRALRKEKEVDVLHLHTLKRLGGIVRREARRRGIPYVVSLHGGLIDVPLEEQQQLTAPLRGAFEWGKVLGLWLGSHRVLQDAAAIICVDRGERDKMQQLHPDKRVLFLPNGVECARYAKGDGHAFRERHGIDPAARLVLIMGRIDPQKNQFAAIEAFATLKKAATKNQATQLLICGPVTHRGYLEKIQAAIREHGLQREVTVLEGLPPGSNDQVDAYHAADVFLLSSMHEPFGIVILEAWAAGLPVVAARVGGVPAFVEHQHNGLLFSSGNHSDLVKQLSRALSDRELATRIAARGQQTATQQYDWSRVTDQLLNLYDEVSHAHSVHA